MSADAARLLTTLADPPIHLEPLDESHREPLRAACAEDDAIWDIYTVSMLGAQFDASFDAIMANPGRLAFALFAGGVLIGTSCYLNVAAAERQVEIGGTYLAPPARGTGINGRLKRLMIDHAIACGFARIEFRIDVRNGRSMAAVEKLGAVRETILPRERTTWTGHVRDTAVYALRAEEWIARG